MERQEAQRKALKIDDPTLEDNETMEVANPGAPAPSPRPSTRSVVNAQNPTLVAKNAPPASKFAASYKRFQELNEQTRKELTMNQASPISSNPISQSTVEVTQQSAVPVVEKLPQEEQQLQTDLSLLVTTGLIREEVIVGGFKFVMHTLTVKENSDVITAMNTAKDELERLARVRIAMLARAIETVNGTPLEDFPGLDRHLSAIPRKEVLLQSLQLSVIAKLFDTYNDMFERSQTALRGTQDETTLKN